MLLIALLVVGSFAAAPPANATAARPSQWSSLAGKTKVNRVVVSRVKIDMPVRKGVIGGTVRERIAYHYPGTSWPGGNSNTYLYAHARAGSFLNLKKMRPGDIVRLHLVSGGWVRYMVTKVKRVALERRQVDAAHSPRRPDPPDLHGQHQDCGPACCAGQAARLTPRLPCRSPSCSA